ncbi:MAG: 50S ribosomal protein L19 [Cytophagales bacterium]
MDRIIKDVRESFVFDRPSIPDFNLGDTVEMHLKVTEKNKERIQRFEAKVIKIKRRKDGSGSVRLYKKITEQFGVYRIIPFSLPSIVKIVVKRRADR